MCGDGSRIHKSPRNLPGSSIYASNTTAVIHMLCVIKGGWDPRYFTVGRKAIHREYNVESAPRAVQCSSHDKECLMEGLALKQRNLGLNLSSTTQNSCLAYEPQFPHVQNEGIVFSELI